MKLQQVVTVDYSPEKAGVGGSTPSLATIIILENQPKISPVISHLWLLAKLTLANKQRNWKLTGVDEGRKRVLLIAAKSPVAPVNTLPGSCRPRVVTWVITGGT